MGGRLGNSLTSLFGGDPQRMIDDDLARLAFQLRGPRPAAGEMGTWR